MNNYEKFENVPFDSLIGEHTLDAVDTAAVDFANGIMFRLNGKVYVAVEDSNDGYRSAMEKLFVLEVEMKNVFPPVKVLARYSNRDTEILEFVDAANGLVILSVGTDHSDDYYPMFVAEWSPQNMAQNAGK